ncbi:MAG: hypothetical protein LBI86_06890 [Treponema sp.]|jgi:hypothetical protein|nr:hypothetical protein [Treponema sp.]
MRKISLLFLTVCLAGAFFFPGCDTDGGTNPALVSDSVPMPPALTGTWVSTWGEEFEINAATFTSGYAGTPSYSGSVVNVRLDAFGGGYITIRYTENATFPGAVGKYYVIHWKNLTGSSVDISGSSDGNGRAAQWEAEYEYVSWNGYFSYYSSCTKS